MPAPQGTPVWQACELQDSSRIEVQHASETWSWEDMAMFSRKHEGLHGFTASNMNCLSVCWKELEDVRCKVGYLENSCPVGKIIYKTMRRFVYSVRSDDTRKNGNSQQRTTCPRTYKLIYNPSTIDIATTNHSKFRYKPTYHNWPWLSITHLLFGVPPCTWMKIQTMKRYYVKKNGNAKPTTDQV